MLSIDIRATASSYRSRAQRKIALMTIRIAILAVSLLAAGAAQAQGSATQSGAQAPVSSLQGQKPWDFLTASPAMSQREVPTTGSVVPQPRRAIDRSER